MKALRGRNQRYSSQEDAYLFNYREWRNEKVSESWAQFLARFEKKFWVNPRSSASLFRRAGRLSGRRHQTLSRNGEMMCHMLKIRKSSLWWTWGRIGQAFGTNARTASGAYKSFLQRNGIDEVQDESGRIIWTRSNRRKLSRAHHLGHSWEQIAKQFGYEEYICIAAHYIHSYGEGKSGNLNASFHPKYFFSTIERTSIYHKQNFSSTREIKDESRDCQWEENIMAQYRREQSLLKCDAEEDGASVSGNSQLFFGAEEPLKRQLTFGLEH
ncbi:8dacc04f-a607-4a6e-8c95-7bdc7fd5075b [Sclerotinia trifoliorum]|uniref:8dacc04f-a607-4a6e-8c95-7bdc7fd5075b n=1 Tax=Sclerotinia trifoliorum TaxID=28548 RepID=A0A8H2W6B0_9HELO|nr:8dacc04f-a607-4a6e-8c95-7bdc7fd5075b [Sclerotinia trifoliorum]